MPEKMQDENVDKIQQDSSRFSRSRFGFIEELLIVDTKAIYIYVDSYKLWY